MEITVRRPRHIVTRFSCIAKHPSPREEEEPSRVASQDGQQDPTKYARPIFTACTPVISMLHNMLESSRLRRREERPRDVAESTSTSAASTAMTKRQRTYMPTPSRSPGQLEKSTCARWPQKKAMCVAGMSIPGMFIGGMSICIGGGGGVAIELSWRLQP